MILHLLATGPLLLSACSPSETVPEPAPPPVGVTGTVSDASGQPIAGIMVTARPGASVVETTVFTSADGTFRIEGLPDDTYAVSAHHPGWRAGTAPVTVVDGQGPGVALTVDSGRVDWATSTSSAWLDLLPDDAMRRRLIGACTQCHTLTAEFLAPGGTPRTAEQWRSLIAAKGTGLDASAMGAWLASHLTTSAMDRIAAPPLADPSVVEGVVVTEYRLPHPDAHPHDLALGPGGRPWVTTPFRSEAWAVNPATGDVEAFGVPGEGSGMAALAFDAAGMLWVADASSRTLVRVDPTSRETEVFDVGAAPTGLAFGDGGRVWFADRTGPATRLGRVGVAEEPVETFTLSLAPGAPAGAAQGHGPIADGRGRLFTSQILGNSITRFDLGTTHSKVYVLPNAHAAPGRPSLGPDGSIWVPERATGHAAQFDPMSAAFRSTDLGVGTAGLAAASVRQSTGVVWMAAALDSSVFSLNPRSGAIRRIRLPTETALGHVVAVQEGSGDVWVGFRSVGGVAARVARVSQPR